LERSWLTSESRVLLLQDISDISRRYGPEAAHASMLLAGTARNVGLVYIDMHGVGRRALLRRAGRTFVKARFSSNKPGPNRMIS